MLQQFTFYAKKILIIRINHCANQSNKLLSTLDITSHQKHNWSDIYTAKV